MNNLGENLEEIKSKLQASIDRQAAFFNRKRRELLLKTEKGYVNHQLYTYSK